MIIDTSAPEVDPSGIVLAVETAKATAATPTHQLGKCEAIGRGLIFLNPLFDAQRYSQDFAGKQLKFDRASELRVVKAPTHGVFEQSSPAEERAKFHYRYILDETRDFMGDDYIVVDIQSGSDVLRIYYRMSVNVGQPTWTLDEDGNKIPDLSRCPQELWKISLNSRKAQVFDAGSALRNAGMMGLVAQAQTPRAERRQAKGCAAEFDRTRHVASAIKFDDRLQYVSRCSRPSRFSLAPTPSHPSPACSAMSRRASTTPSSIAFKPHT